MFGKFMIIISISAFILTGCSIYGNNLMESDNNPPISPFPVRAHEKIELYFPNGSMTKLEKEPRIVEATKSDLYNVIIEELISGSQNSSRSRVIPEDTKLLSLEVVDRVAYVSFSKDLVDKNLSEQEEAFIIYSIVNTLTERNDINKVQILIEGEIRKVLNKRCTILYPKEYSLKIVENPYESPLDVIEDYYDTILAKNYENIVDLFSINRKKDVKRGVYRSFYEDLQGAMNSYRVNDYVFIDYGYKVSVSVNITIHYEKDKIKEGEIQYFELVDEKGQYKIEDISMESENFATIER